MGSCISSSKRDLKDLKNQKGVTGLSEPLVKAYVSEANVSTSNPLRKATGEPCGNCNERLNPYEIAPIFEGSDVTAPNESQYKNMNPGNVRKDVFSNGDYYEGEHTIVRFRDKKGIDGKKAVKHGKGKYVYCDGSTFEGYYFENEMLEGRFFHAKNLSTYTGRFKDSHYHGHGKIEYHEAVPSSLDSETTSESISTNSEQSTVLREVEYEGEFKFGLRSGHGKLKLSNGTLIEGLFRCDKLLATNPNEVDESGQNWTAKVSLNSGRVYNGPLNERYLFQTHHLEQCITSKPNESRLKLPNGDVVKGHFNLGKLVLPARVEMHDGGTWVGNFDEDYNICGHGKLSNKFGDVYIGTVTSGGVRDGEGTQSSPNGSTYKGQWKDNEFDGQGEMKFVDGAIYTGEWVKGKRHGVGKMTFSSGNQYVGQWAGDKKHGEGRATFVNGDVFEGTYKDDRRHGKGTTVHADGRPIERAIYADGELVKVIGGARKLTNSVKFVGRMLGVRKHGEPLFSSSIYSNAATLEKVNAEKKS